MTLSDAERELLLRRLDAKLTADEQEQVDALLRSSAAAREFLREVAEQAVAVADVERGTLSRQAAVISQFPELASKRERRRPVHWYGGLAISIGTILSLAALSALAFLPSQKPTVARISRVTGSSSYFAASGMIDDHLVAGTSVGAGDTLETRSCDAWITLEAKDGTTATIAGHSTFRILQPGVQSREFELLRGSLWVMPAASDKGTSVAIHTPCGEVVASGSQFDIQATDTEMVVRVNSGRSKVTAATSGSSASVDAGQQLRLSLGSRQPLLAVAQAKPVNRWTCNLDQSPEVLLGKWLPRSDGAPASLGAEPLLWPIDEQRKIMLYAVAFAAWKNSDRPVLLDSSSQLRFRGRTAQPHTVRFGFSAQKMRGVFAGKFEVDVEPSKLGPAGQAWQVDLPLANFRALYPHLAESAEGLELTDVYALTVETDAGLEIHDIELLPGGAVP